MTESSSKKKSIALPIAMMFAMFFIIAFVSGLPSPMGVIVAKQFNATTFQSQLGYFANFIAYFFMGYPAGLMLRYIGYKKTGLAALAIGFVGVFIQYLSGVTCNFIVYLIGAFIAGFSMCILNTVVNPMINYLGGGGKRGNQLIQIGGTFNSLAATITPILVGNLMGPESGRTIEKAEPAIFLAMGIFLVVFIILLFVKIPEPHIEKRVKDAPKIKDPHSPFSFRHFVLGIIAIFFYVGLEVSIPSTANLYMTKNTREGAEFIVAEYNKQQADPTYMATLAAEDEANKLNEDYEAKIIATDSYLNACNILNGDSPEGLGISAGIAGTFVGIYWFLMLIGRFIGSTIGNKVSGKSMLTFAVSLAIVLILAAILVPPVPINISFLVKGEAFVPLSIIFLTLCGLCTSIMWGAIFNLSVEGLGKYTTTASGIFMIMVCGGGVLPLIQGLIADVSNYITSYWVIIAALVYILFYAVAGSKNVNKDIVTE